jgi:hypothetical protein
MHFWRLKQILIVHGQSIKKLIWDSCKLTRVEVIALLNLLPNLESLECISWKLESEFYDEPIETLTTHRLRELKITKGNEATTDFFLSHLPHQILHSLCTDFDSCRILEHQSNVKVLDMSVDVLPHNNNLFNLPPLSHLTLMLSRYKYRDGYQILHSLLPFQNLTYLDLMKCEGIFDADDESFVCICNMQELVTLKINVDELSKTAFKENFYKLTNLTTFEMESVDHDNSPLVDIIEDLSNMKMPRVKALRIDVDSVGIPLSRVENFGLNFTSLKVLTVKCNSPLPLDLFLKNIKSLEEIKIDYHYNREFSKICNDYDSHVFANLKHLEMNGFNFGSEVNSNETSLIRLVKMLPNLETLDIDINMPLNSKILPNILSKMPKLSAIHNLNMVQTAYVYEKWDAEFIRSLIETANKLRKFSIELKLKSAEMNPRESYGVLGEKFKYTTRTCGVFTILALNKK